MATETQVGAAAVRGGSFLTEERVLEEVFTPEDFSDEQRMIGRTAEEFMEKEMVPRLPEILALDYRATRELLRKAGELGLLGGELERLGHVLVIDAQPDEHVVRVADPFGREFERGDARSRAPRLLADRVQIRLVRVDIEHLRGAGGADARQDRFAPRSSRQPLYEEQRAGGRRHPPALSTKRLRSSRSSIWIERSTSAMRGLDLPSPYGFFRPRRPARNSALVARNAMINPIDTADGKVIAAQQGVPTAFINLGKKDMLQPGTVFRIRNPHSSVVKAHAIVTRVEEERSAIELSDIVDPIGDFVRAGDELYNEIYTPRATRTIYLLGRFQAPYNKPELTALLKRLGNKVVDKMGPGVDTVILGNDPINEAADGFDAVTNSKEYKEALDLRVEFSYLKNIRDLIKL